MNPMPDVRVGDPIRHEALTLFPLYPRTDGPAGLDYLLADDAMASGTVVVEEVSESGSVPTLLVENRSGSRVLFLEGEELRGAKQNRVLNTSVLVAAGSRTRIPVSCVEQGRWGYRTRQFGSAGTYSPPKLRAILKRSASRSVEAGQGHLADQGEVWSEVSRQMSALGSHSETAAMADTYEAHRDRTAEFQARLEYVEGAIGLAVALGEALVAVDVFDKPETCRKVWHRLLTGVVLDALEAKPADRPPQPGDVEAFLAKLRAASWQPAEAVGEGQEYRSDADAQTHASALLADGVVVHGSATVAG